MSKICALVANVAQLYHTCTPLRGTQLVFCDLATPKGSGRSADEPPTRLTSAELEGEAAEGKEEIETDEERWLSNFVYYEIRDGLIAQGIPRDEIAFIHDYATKAQRDALFAAMNEGRVRVLLGSTGKMGTGMNVQQLLIALHNLDCPWRPGDLEQRHGRILRQGNHWPQVYLFSYIAEGSFDAYQYQLIESKARFIEQALAGEITARTAEDTSDVVLSAAEIKAIASGNPHIVRKVQLEAEVARLERVRGVWLDTRRNLQLERHFTEEEIRRVEGRHSQWERAAALVASHPHEPFYAEVATSVGSETCSSLTSRAEAGAAVRRLVHDYQSAAAFQRRRLRGLVARYRGLELVVQAHAVFAADLHLALPDGTTLDAITAATDTGVWQSVGRTVSDIPHILTRLQGRIAEANERIVTIDRELVRLEQWDGQAAYDAAVSELQAINAAFAAAEEQAAEEQANSEPGGSATSMAEGAGQAGVTTPADEPSLADLLLVLAQEERGGDDWGEEWQPVIPPSPASLAWMAAEAEQWAVSSPATLEPIAVQPLEVMAEQTTAAEVGRPHTPASNTAQFGDTRGQRQPQRPAPRLASHDTAEVSQLPLF